MAIVTVIYYPNPICRAVPYGTYIYIKLFLAHNVGHFIDRPLKMLFHINPLRIKNNDDANFMDGFFKHHQNIPAFLKNRNYTYNNHTVRLSHTVLRVQDAQHYHVVSNTELGRGAYSVVYPIKMDMRFSDEGVYIYDKPTVPIIAKIQSTSGIADQLDYFKNKLLHEYEHSKAGHLNAEMPVFIEDVFSKTAYESEFCEITSIMVLNRIEGIEFFDLLRIIMAQNNVSCYLRFILTLELFRAFNEQVFQKNIIHGDLKPENLIIIGGEGTTPDTFVAINDLSNKNFVPAWKLNVIDFEGAEHLGINRSRLIVTGAYTAPETLLAAKQPYSSQGYPSVDDEKTDLFSVAQIIACVWGLLPQETALLTDKQKYSALLFQRRPLFANESKIFNTSLLPSIYSAIACMTHKDPAMRWSLNQSLAFFEKTLNRYNHLEFVGTLPECGPIEPELDRIHEDCNLSNKSVIGCRSMSHLSPVSIMGINENDIICVKRSVRSPAMFFNPPIIIENELNFQQNSIKSDDDSVLDDIAYNCGRGCNVM